ncbi:MAG: mechanosensitive ion channel family protein, partial [Bacteroidota bacterium]|nr:mechanosensitive ion channel family protein [Bacteroidota bacterium]
MKDLTTLLPSSERMVEIAITYGGQLLLALITLVIGLWLIGKLIKILKRIFEMRSFEQTLQSFLISLIAITL